MRGRADRVHFADGRSVQTRDAPSDTTEEDVSERVALDVIGAIVDIEDDFPKGARLDVIAVADRQHDHAVGQVDGSDVAVVYVP